MLGPERTSDKVENPETNLTALGNLLSKIIPWLYPGNVAEKHQMLRGQRVDSSGNWFVNSVEFQNWAHGRGPNLLICPGIRTQLSR